MNNHRGDHHKAAEIMYHEWTCISATHGQTVVWNHLHVEKFAVEMVLLEDGAERWNVLVYRGAGKSLAWPTSLCILFDGENISFDASLVIYINSTNIPPNMIINRIYEH
jgi:hypothetical protein